MKTVGLLIASMLVFSTANARHFNRPSEVLSLQEELDSATIKGLIDDRNRDTTIFCEEGTELPLELFFKFPLVSIKQNPHLTFKIEEPCYLRFVKKKAYVSKDLEEWVAPEKFFSGNPKLNLKKNYRKLLVEAIFPAKEENSDY